MPIAIIYRGPGPWGAGQDTDLTADQINQNFYNLAVAVTALQTSRPQPDNISSINVVGTSMTVVLDSGTEIGPLPLPFLRFGWRGAWTPETSYQATDVFVVDQKGIYFVNSPYDSGSDFDDTVVDGDGNPILIKLFGFDQSSDTAYNTGFFYSGRIADQSVGYLYQEQFLLKVNIPATNFHNAYLQEPATADMVLPVLLNDNHVGNITFVAGANGGNFDWLAGDVALDYRDRLAVGLPGSPDAVAGGLSVSFAGVKA